MIVETIVILVLVLLTTTFIRKFMPQTDIDLNALGRWAVITGATDGIGKALAHEVAKRGFNIYLVSRDLKKLEFSANEIREKYGVSTIVFRVDFSEMNTKDTAALKEELRSLDVGLLINNVGFAGPHPEYLPVTWKTHVEVFDSVINVNIMSTVHMTRFILPGMIKAGNGLVINVSSLLSEIPSPMLALYAASKGFVTKFSQDLDFEVRHKGVHVHVLLTGLVSTKMSGADASGWFSAAVTPEDYAKYALDQATKWRTTCGHVYHNFQALAMSVVPNRVLEKIIYVFIKRRTREGIDICHCR